MGNTELVVGNILIVGNGELTTELDYRGFDTVLRMNSGIKDRPCDIWATSFKVVDYKESYNNVIIQLDGRYSKECRESTTPQNWKNTSIYFPVEDYSKMLKDLNYVSPTMGVVSIYYILNFCSYKSITITGYDFGTTPNRYTNQRMFTVHDRDKEKRIITNWIETQQISWY